MADDEVKARLRAQIAAIESSGRAAGEGGRERSLEPAVSARSLPLDGEDASDRGHAQVSRPPKAGEDGTESEQERAFRKIERLACHREQASEALRRRLTREGFEAAAVDEALARAERCGLVTTADMRRCSFAAALRRDEVGGASQPSWLVSASMRRWSRRSRTAPWRTAGEVERALDLLHRKPPRAKNRREAAYRRLIQKGFAADIAVTAARLWCDENPG